MEISILKDIVIIFALSTLVNLVFTKLKMPTILGYLLTGIVAGPHLLKLIESQHQIELLAEIGIILLLFSIGMEFSLKHLMRIRRVVFLGGLMQVSLTAAIFFVASRFYHIDIMSGIFIGLISALSSSALVLKILQERSEITSNYGRTVVGILIFQDLMLVPLLLFTNLLGGDAMDIQREVLGLLLKAILIVLFVYVGNKWLLPKLLHVIAMTRNQELFMMSILVICLGVAWGTSVLGMSLAFGAFLAGLMISDSEYSHNAFGNLVTFKDTFTSFFFVSIGMMLDLHFVFDNYLLVLTSVLLIIGLKTIIAGATGFMLGHTFKGTLMVGLALSQVGEFSFILAKLGLENDVISGFYYQLFLAVAVITMALSPFIIQGAPRFADMLLKFNFIPEVLRKGLFPLPEIEIPELNNHLVIIGKDTSALKLSVMAKLVKLPYAAIVFDPSIVRERQKNGETVIYGDAVNEPILEKAHVHLSDVVVISVGDIIPAMAILDKVRHMNANAYIVVRAKQTEDIEKLYELGADQVMPEKLEIAIDLFTRVLTHRLYTQSQIRKITNDIRENYYGIFREKDVRNKPTLFEELEHLEVAVITVDENSEVNKMALNDSRLRNRTGVTILSIKRGKELIEHPGADTMLCAGDIVYALGTNNQIAKAREFFSE
ncbi:MAG: cation:proton antiporter [Prolixibacteraceae bacterium]|nr:cation:proton antiporter [Prolixibacteraceae bacterium]